MAEVRPKHIRYIKLGRGGAFADEAIANGELLFGYSDFPHEIGIRGDKQEIKAALVRLGVQPKSQAMVRAKFMIFMSLVPIACGSPLRKVGCGGALPNRRSNGLATYARNQASGAG